jgi:hypothetical protein
MIYLDSDLYQRVRKLAERKCMSVHKLCGLYIEMAVCWEELQEKQTIETLIQDVLFVNREWLERVWNDTKEAIGEIQSDQDGSAVETGLISSKVPND